jgi:hypothetical protein
MEGGWAGRLRFGPATRGDLVEGAMTLKAQLHRLIQDGEIVPWKTDVHFERVIRIADPQDRVAVSGNVVDMMVISDDEND